MLLKGTAVKPESGPARSKAASRLDTPVSEDSTSLQESLAKGVAAESAQVRFRAIRGANSLGITFVHDLSAIRD